MRSAWGRTLRGRVDDQSLDMRLVEVTLEMLRTAPVEQLSLRRVAERVGVSHQAPYVHFGSKRRFLAAVAGVGTDRAAAEAEARVQAAGAAPIDRLKALAAAYADWVERDPHVHDLDHVLRIDKSEHPWLQAAAIRYWDLLHDTVEACQPPGVSEADVLRRSTIAWGVVYGISRLAALGQVPAAVPGDARGHIGLALDALYAGWHAGGLLPPDGGSRRARGGRMATGSGTADDPWHLATPSGGSQYTMHVDDAADPPLLVCQVGKTRLTYLARALDDLHAWLSDQGDWVLLGGADEQKPAPEGSVEEWGRSPSNPVGGWYGQKKGLRGRFGVYVPPVLVAQGRAEIVVESRKARVRAL